MDYRELSVYQKAREVVRGLYATIKIWPRSYPALVLSRQVLRAATSIGANIAEGHGRHAGLEYIHYLIIARGSANEVDHWLNTALDLEIGKPETTRHLLQLNNETRKMLTAAINTLQKKQTQKTLRESPVPYSPEIADPLSPIPYSPKNENSL